MQRARLTAGFFHAVDFYDINKKMLKGYTETVSQHRHPRAVKMPYNVLVIIL